MSNLPEINAADESRNEDNPPPGKKVKQGVLAAHDHGVKDARQSGKNKGKLLHGPGARGGPVRRSHRNSVGAPQRQIATYMEGSVTFWFRVAT